MKLRKVSPAVSGSANYNRGAKPATWEVLTDSGEHFCVMFGRFDGQRRSYTAMREGVTLARGFSFANWKRELSPFLN